MLYHFFNDHKDIPANFSLYCAALKDSDNCGCYYLWDPLDSSKKMPKEEKSDDENNEENGISETSF